MRDDEEISMSLSEGRPKKLFARTSSKAVRKVKPTSNGSQDKSFLEFSHAVRKIKIPKIFRRKQAARRCQHVK